MLERIMSTSNTQALATSVEEGMRRQKSRGRGQAESSAIDDASGFSSGDGVAMAAGATGAAAGAAAAATSSAADTAPAGLSLMELDHAPTPATHDSSVLASLKLVLERSPAESELPVLKSRYLSVPRSTTALWVLAWAWWCWAHPNDSIMRGVGRWGAFHVTPKETTHHEQFIIGAGLGLTGWTDAQSLFWIPCHPLSPQIN